MKPQVWITSSGIVGGTALVGHLLGTAVQALFHGGYAWFFLATCLLGLIVLSIQLVCELNDQEVRKRQGAPKERDRLKEQVQALRLRADELERWKEEVEDVIEFYHQLEGRSE